MRSGTVNRFDIENFCALELLTVSEEKLSYDMPTLSFCVLIDIKI
jgi:hypothetical protein